MSDTTDIIDTEGSTDVPQIPSVAEQGLEPDPLLLALARDHPVFRMRAPHGGECWIFTRHEDVRAVQTDHRFSRAAMIGKDVARTSAYPLQGNSILGMDPPDHTRVRRLVSREFTARRVEQLRPRAEEIVAGLLDTMEAAGPPAELISQLAEPLPILMICELLGVEYEDRAKFRQWASAFMVSTGSKIEDILAAHDSLLAYLADLVAQRRRNPTDDLLGALVTLRDEGDALNEDELVNLGLAILVGGFETTAAQIGKAIFCLLVHPDQMRRVQDDPALVPSAVEELLRFIPLSSGTSMAWVATDDVELAGVTVRAGETVMASAATASRDPSVFSDPDHLDVGRDPNPHVGFGHGTHFCLGAHLARMEMQVSIGTLLARFPDLRLAVPVDEVPWKVGSAVWGLAELPVAF
ncbi:MAG: cytochrome P450 [Acidimicrobiia bacterium]